MSLFFSMSAFGQVYQLMPQYGYNAYRMNFDSTLSIPTVCGVPTLKSNLSKKSAIAYDTCNKRFYLYDAKLLAWDTIKGGGTASDTASVVKATVKNAEATTITKGTVVYLYGATGNMASVKRAYNTSDTFSSKTFAIVKNDITAGGTGTVITQGVVDKLQLGSYSEGDIVWLDSIAGQFTKNRPSAPYHQVFIGVVERANNGNGQLYVKIQNGYELGELHNVSVNGQSDNDVLYYQTSTKLWKAKSAYQLIDTSKLSARIDLRMKYTDTTSLSNRINAKMGYSDTASLSNRINTKMNYTDTASLSDRINLKLNSADSSVYQTKYRTDTMRTNIYSAINGKQASGSYLNISDTATMLSKYLRKTDTTSLSNRINLKVNISDTASMLTNYAKTSAVNLKVNISDTASMLTNYAKTSAVNLKLNISDTSSMLSNYYRRTDTLLSTKFRVNFSASTTDFPVIIKNTNASAVQSNVLSFDCSATGADQPVFVNLASTNAKGMVFFASNQATSSSPAGAGFQIYSTSSTNFPGQMYFDGGAHNSSSLIFRTAQTSGTITQRMRVFAGGNVQIGGSGTDAGYKLDCTGTLRATQFYLSSLNTAPASATATGTTGEIRIDANFIYICTATNTWKRVAIATW